MSGSLLGAATVRQVTPAHSSSRGVTQINQSLSQELSELLAAVTAGDQTAFSDFYDQTNAVVCGLARRILCDETGYASRCETSEEVTVNVFIQVWQEAGSFDMERESPLSWLTVMTRNQALGRLRAASHQSHGAAQEPEELDMIDSPEVQASTTEFASMLAGRHLLINTALAKLTTEQRLLINAAYFEGLSMPAITKRFQLPLEAVKTNIYEGMIALRQHVYNLNK